MSRLGPRVEHATVPGISKTRVPNVVTRTLKKVEDLLRMKIWGSGKATYLSRQGPAKRGPSVLEEFGAALVRAWAFELKAWH